jgi:hypothetical protein
MWLILVSNIGMIHLLSTLTTSSTVTNMYLPDDSSLMVHSPHSRRINFPTFPIQLFLTMSTLFPSEGIQGSRYVGSMEIWVGLPYGPQKLQLHSVLVGSFGFPQEPSLQCAHSNQHVETRLECPEHGMECISPLILLESLLQRATVFELTQDKHTKYSSK